MCPNPPFHPCTAMTVEPGVIMLRARAFRIPKRIRLSTFSRYQHNSHHSVIEYTHISLPLVGLDATGLRIPEWIASTVEVNLARRLLVSGDYKNALEKTEVPKHQGTYQ